MRGWNTTSPSERIATFAALFRVGDDVERPRVQPVHEGIVQQEDRHAEHLRIARMLDAVALERAEVVGVAELGPELLEDVPVALLAVVAEHVGHVPPEVALDRVVVEQRVVHVEQDHPQRASSGGHGALV